MIASATSRSLPFQCSPSLSDADLADEIISHACKSIESSCSVDIDSYLSRIETAGSTGHKAVLAAMSVGIRTLKMTGVALEDAGDVLIQRYPDLQNYIEQAQSLESALGTTSLGSTESSRPQSVALPAECGPHLQSSGEYRYQLESLIGNGSHGSVFRAIDKLLTSPHKEALVAVKLTRPDDGNIHTAVAEAIKARRVNHHRVVRVQDAGYSRELDSAFTVFEYVPGGTLADLIRSGSKMSTRDRIELVCQIAQGLSAIHRAGIIHCDIKPANILIDEYGIPRVADLGIAKSLDTEADSDTPAGGTLAFVAPEQLSGSTPTTACDVYGLAALALWLLTGKVLMGADRSLYQRLHDDQNTRRTHAVLDLESSDLSAIIARSLSINPDNRHDSVQHLQDDLQRWLAVEPIEWLEPSVVKRTAMACRRRPFHAIAYSVLLLSTTLIAHQWQSLSVNAARSEAWGIRRTIETDGLFKLMDDFDNGERGPERRLTMLWGIDSLAKSGMLDKALSNKKSIEELRDIARNEYESSDKNSLDQVMWGLVAVTWMIASEEPAPSAQQVIDDCSTILGHYYPSDTSWRFRCDLLADCVYIKERWHQQPKEPSSLPIDVIALQDAAQRLEYALAIIEEDSPYGVVHRDLLRWLRHVYGRSLLHQHDDWYRILAKEELLGRV